MATVSSTQQVVSEGEAKSLLAFQWPPHEFDPVELKLDDYKRALRDTAEHLGHELSDDEIVEATITWSRFNGVLLHGESFEELLRLSFNFVDALITEGREQGIAQLAGLKNAPPGLGPSVRVVYEPDFIPEPPLNFIGHQERAGGRLNFGAKLLWWCAAAHDFRPFGYHEWHRVRLMQQPIWVRQSGLDKWHFDQLTLNAIKDVAKRLVSTGTNPLSLPAPVTSHPDGFDENGLFWRHNKELTYYDVSGRVMSRVELMQLMAALREECRIGGRRATEFESIKAEEQAIVQGILCLLNGTESYGLRPARVPRQRLGSLPR